MKRIVSKAILAGILFSGVNCVLADGSGSSTSSSAESNNNSSDNAQPGSEAKKSVGSSSLCAWVSPFRKWVCEDHRTASTVIGLVAAAFVGHKIMVSVCPWYKRLICDEDDEEATPVLKPKPRGLNPEMNPSRVY